MSDKSYNEYQWSIMFGDNEQIVVRKDDLKELLLDRQLVKDVGIGPNGQLIIYLKRKG